jgi:hypothetical protein
MARDYLLQIRTIQSSGPYHLVDWSFGADAGRGQLIRTIAIGLVPYVSWAIDIFNVESSHNQMLLVPAVAQSDGA